VILSLVSHWAESQPEVNGVLLSKAASEIAVNASEPIEEDENGETIEERVATLTRAIAPILLPMISSLGALELEEALAATASGEAT
jgi:hypothetical protein